MEKLTVRHWTKVLGHKAYFVDFKFESPERAWEFFITKRDAYVRDGLEKKFELELI